MNDNALLEAGIALCVMNFFCRFFVMHTGKFIKVSVSETLIEKYENAQGNFKIFMCENTHRVIVQRDRHRPLVRGQQLLVLQDDRNAESTADGKNSLHRVSSPHPLHMQHLRATRGHQRKSDTRVLLGLLRRSRGP